ncbi:thiol S-methyltransferase TMT1B-like isoform X2 [Tachypleus tridentatus]
MAENMAEIPENSVDAVVSTCVLCSVMKIQDVLHEIKRVLVPGGKFFTWNISDMIVKLGNISFK